MNKIVFHLVINFVKFCFVNKPSVDIGRVKVAVAHTFVI